MFKTPTHLLSETHTRKRYYKFSYQIMMDYFLDIKRISNFFSFIYISLKKILMA